MNETILILTGMASLVLSVSGIAAILSTADTGVPDSAHSDGNNISRVVPLHGRIASLVIAMLTMRPVFSSV